VFLFSTIIKWRFIAPQRRKIIWALFLDAPVKNRFGVNEAKKIDTVGNHQFCCSCQWGSGGLALSQTGLKTPSLN
jgi:hypothetical protein